MIDHDNDNKNMGAAEYFPDQRISTLNDNIYDAINRAASQYKLPIVTIVGLLEKIKHELLEGMYDGP